MSRHCSIGSSGSKNLAHKTNFRRSLKSTAKEQGGPPCEICGTSPARYLNQLLVCKCGAREHIYCMRFPLSKVPKVWVCEDCNPVKSMQPSYQRPTTPRTQFPQDNKKVKYLTLQEVIERDRSASSAQFRSLLTPSKMKFRSEKLQSRSRKSNNFVPNSPIKKKTKPPLLPMGLAKPVQSGYRVSNDLPHSNQASVESRKEDVCVVDTSGRMQMEFVTVEASMETDQPRAEPGSSVKIAKGDSHVKNFISKSPNKGKTPLSPLGLQKIHPHSNRASGEPKKGKLFKSVDGSLVNDSNPTEQTRFCTHDTGLSYKKKTNPLAMSQKSLLIQDPPLSNSCAISSTVAWLGSFLISDPAVSEDCNGKFVAYLPSKVGSVSYNLSGFLYGDLAVELIPLGQLSLDFCSMDLLGVGLYIFPDPKSKRSARDFCHLLRLMITRDLAIKFTVYDGLDLLIFTSEQLPLDEHCKISASATFRSERRGFMLGAFYYTETNSSSPYTSPPTLPKQPSPPPAPPSSSPPSTPPPPSSPPHVTDVEPPHIHSRPQSQWSCPHGGWVKLNTTSTSTVTHSFAFGCVHNSKGEWVFGYILKLSKAEQSTTELWALFQGLLLLWSKGFRRVEVESDFDQTQNSLRGGAVLESDPNKDLLKCCRNLLLREWDITRNVVSKEQNYPAAWLATNFGGDQDDYFKILEKPPVGLLQTIWSVNMEQDMEWDYT